MTTPIPTIEQLRKEWENDTRTIGTMMPKFVADWWLSRISSLLTKRDEALRKSIFGLRKNANNEARESVADIHNSALDDVLSLITNQEKI